MWFRLGFLGYKEKQIPSCPSTNAAVTRVYEKQSWEGWQSSLQHSHLDQKRNPLTTRMVTTFKMHEKIEVNCPVQERKSQVSDAKEGLKRRERAPYHWLGSAIIPARDLHSPGTCSVTVQALRVSYTAPISCPAELSALQVHGKIWISPMNRVLTLFIQPSNSSGIAQDLHLCEIKLMAYSFNIPGVLPCGLDT